MTILAVATDREVVEIWSDQDWAEPWGFSTADDAGTETPRDFTGCSVVGGLVLYATDGSETARIDLSSGDGTLTIDDDVVTVRVPREAILAIPAGLYDFGLTMIDAGGAEQGLLRGRRQVVRGVRP